MLAYMHAGLASLTIPLVPLPSPKLPGRLGLWGSATSGPAYGHDVGTRANTLGSPLPKYLTLVICMVCFHGKQEI